jgi:hypothetical protein
MMKKFLILLFIPLFYNILYADLVDLNTTTEYTKEISHSFRKSTTKGYHRLLQTIDSYFSENEDINKTAYRQIRKNRLQIVLSIKEGTKLNLHLRGKIVLPQLKNRVELTFSQRDNQEIDNQSASSGYDDVVSDSKLHIGLKYYLYKKRRSSAYAKLSFKIRSPFGPYLKFGIDKSYLNDNLLETSFQNAFYYYLNGNDVAASTAVTFYKPLTTDYWIGQGNKLFWEGERKLYLRNNIILYQIFDLNNRIAYKIDYTTSYDHIEKLQHESCSISAGYFHRFDKWFFVEAVPKLKKSREHGYGTETLFTLNLGMLLSK